ncbi:helix-turn-helix domain-containing protein [Microcoleus asticus]|uniref:helix-turn-helix domain-containing protein n=1 Tax=Microcoleus asticus TaxID=2815231 RepID=UPI0030DD5A50
MLHKAIQVRLYPTQNQHIQLVPTLGCARWWWNSGLNKSIEVYKTTRKKLCCSRLNTLFIAKKSDGSAWLDECCSQFLPANALTLTATYNFFLYICWVY